MSAKIDVVVPIYNAERHISGLIRNFENQLFKDFRVIFVNDGSSDNSLSELEKELKSVTFPYKVVSRKNGGAAVARNTGLRLADAPFVVCVDCDDLFLPEFFLYLYRAVSENSADFAYAQYLLVPENKVIDIPEAGDFDAIITSPEDCMKEHYAAWFSHVCMIFNREFFLKYDLFYDEDCRYCEDNTFITRAIAYAEKVVRISNTIYVYYVYRGSLSHSPKVEKFMSGIKSFCRMDEELKNNPSPAAQMYRSIASGRFFMSTFRFSALQMKYKDFRKVVDSVSPERYRHQIPRQAFMKRAAGYLFLFSKKLFYIVTRLMFHI